jgi:hypothetical protein
MIKEGKELHIYCDGEELPLAPFISKLYYDTIVAMAANLKGAETATTITISLTRPTASS